MKKMSDDKSDRKIGIDTQNYARCPKCGEFYLAHDGHACRTRTSERVERK